MRHIREIDPQHTVIMVQVENETGSYGSPRDFSPQPTAVRRTIPAELARKIGKSGTWRRHSARKADQRLQRLVHRALRRRDRRRRPSRAQPADVCQRRAQRPVRTEGAQDGASGGPDWPVIEIWKAAAPHIAIAGAGPLRPRLPKVYAQRSIILRGPTIRCSSLRTATICPSPASSGWRSARARSAGLRSAWTRPIPTSRSAGRILAGNARRFRVEIRAAPADRARLGAARVRTSDGRLRQARGRQRISRRRWAGGRSPRNTDFGHSASATGPV